MSKLTHEIVVEHLNVLSTAASDEIYTMDFEEAQAVSLWLQDNDAELRRCITELESLKAAVWDWIHDGEDAVLMDAYYRCEVALGREAQE